MLRASIVAGFLACSTYSFASASVEPYTAQLRVTSENSGVCGYGDIAEDKHVWFWFFEARNHPESAPLVAWFNGGPASSSEYAVMTELGPCRITNDSSGFDFNPTSWNEVANIIFIDQPIGVGFSYGGAEINDTIGAAEDAWDFMQVFLTDEKFKKYGKGDFGIWTSSYGGHYGPVFSKYFLEQNQAIADGKTAGTKINLNYLGIGDGLTNPAVQYPELFTYQILIISRYHPLVNASFFAEKNDTFYRPGGCLDLIKSCNSIANDADSYEACHAACELCNGEILYALAGDWDQYYVLQTKEDPGFPGDITPRLTDPDLLGKINPQDGVEWVGLNLTVFYNFNKTCDWMRDKSSHLESVIDAGVRVAIYAGDADYIVNYMGIEKMVDALQMKFTDEWAQQEFANFSVKGANAGLFKNAGTLSYVRLFGAGHQAPAYEWPGVERGAAALQMFSQIMANQSLSPT
ncbi:serine carboxypeptidase [Flagelloscypha sp. PMI_526]|nr:serine carboxypeptidase [Flagelloscypha sp. PMI_526]